MIGDDITITISEIRNERKVRVAIEAPKDVPVHRREVYEAIQRNGGVQSKKES
jgi:carbon storage regulator